MLENKPRLFFWIGFILIAGLVSAAIGYSLTEKEDDPNIIVRVGDEAITMEDLEEKYYGIELSGGPEEINEKINSDIKQRNYFLDLLVEESLIRQFSKENNVSVTNKEVEEIASQETKDWDILTDYQKEVTLRQHENTLLREKTINQIVTWKKGRYIEIRFDKNFVLSDALSKEDRAKRETTQPEDIKKDKEYADRLKDTIYEELTSGKITFKEAMDKVRNDDFIDYTNWDYTVSDPGVEFDTLNSPEQENLLEKEDFAKVINTLGKGEISKPFLRKLDYGNWHKDEVKMVDSVWVILIVDEEFEGKTSSIKKWFAEKKAQVGVESYIDGYNSIKKASAFAPTALAWNQTACTSGRYNQGTSHPGDLISEIRMITATGANVPIRGGYSYVRHKNSGAYAYTGCPLKGGDVTIGSSTYSRSEASNSVGCMYRFSSVSSSTLNMCCGDSHNSHLWKLGKAGTLETKGYWYRRYYGTSTGSSWGGPYTGDFASGYGVRYSGPGVGGVEFNVLNGKTIYLRGYWKVDPNVIPTPARVSVTSSTNFVANYSRAGAGGGLAPVVLTGRATDPDPSDGVGINLMYKKSDEANWRHFGANSFGNNANVPSNGYSVPVSYGTCSTNADYAHNKVCHTSTTRPTNINSNGWKVMNSHASTTDFNWQNSGTNIAYPTVYLKPGTYYWAVRAIDKQSGYSSWTTNGSFTVRAAPATTLLSPASNATIAQGSNNVRFSASITADPSPNNLGFGVFVRYRQVGTSTWNNFSASALTCASGGTNNSINVNGWKPDVSNGCFAAKGATIYYPYITLPAGSYEWQARGLYGNYTGGQFAYGPYTTIRTFTVQAPVAAPTCNITAPALVQAGSNFQVSWTSTNATSISATNNGLPTSPVASGSTVRTASTYLSVTQYNWSMTFTGSGGSRTCTATTNVNHPPTATLNSPANGAVGLTPPVTLSATATDTDITPDRVDVRILYAKEGTSTWTPACNWSTYDPSPKTRPCLTVANLEPNTLYYWMAQARDNRQSPTITSVTRSFRTLAPPTCTLSASPNQINPGGSSTLSYTVSSTAANRAASASINNGIGVVSLFSGSRVVSPTANTTYVMTVSNWAGTASCSAAVYINPPPTISHISPPNTSVGHTPPVALTARATSASGGVKIRIRYAKEGLDSPWLTACDYNSTFQPPGSTGYPRSCTTGSDLLPNTTYYWRASVIDENGIAVHHAAWSFRTLAPPTCGLGGADSIDAGDSLTLNYTASSTAFNRAASASINNGIGPVALFSGSRAVSPTANTTYVMTVSNWAGTRTCTHSVAIRSLTCSVTPTEGYAPMTVRGTVGASGVIGPFYFIKVPDGSTPGSNPDAAIANPGDTAFINIDSVGLYTIYAKSDNFLDGNWILCGPSNVSAQTPPDGDDGEIAP